MSHSAPAIPTTMAKKAFVLCCLLALPVNGTMPLL